MRSQPPIRHWGPLTVLGLLIPAFSVGAAIITGNILLVLASLVPAGLILPLLVLLDRHEPEPSSQRWAAFAFGFGVAGVVAGVVNTAVAIVVGIELGTEAGLAIAAVVSAPVIEELLKMQPVRRAERLRTLNGPLDGFIMASWSALGFTVVEDFLYLSRAVTEGDFAEVFVVRCLFSPLAHTLFTASIGIGYGLRARHGYKHAPLLGVVVAMTLHALWNGSATVSPALFLLVYGVMALGLVALTSYLVVTGNSDNRTVRQVANQLASQGWLSPRQHQLVKARISNPERSLIFGFCLASADAVRNPTRYHLERRATLLREVRRAETPLEEVIRSQGFLPPPGWEPVPRTLRTAPDHLRHLPPPVRPDAGMPLPGNPLLDDPAPGWPDPSPGRAVLTDLPPPSAPETPDRYYTEEP